MTVGRWPTNVVLTHSPACTDVCAGGCPVAELDRQSEGTRSAKPSKSGTVMGSGMWGLGGERHGAIYDDSGGASRFFPTFHYSPEDFHPEQDEAMASYPDPTELSPTVDLRFGDCLAVLREFAD